MTIFGYVPLMVFIKKVKILIYLNAMTYRYYKEAMQAAMKLPEHLRVKRRAYGY